MQDITLPDDMGELSAARFVEIRQGMEATYADRRTLINSGPELVEIKKEYPALFLPGELEQEFCRLMTIDISPKMEEKLRECAPRIISLAKKRKTSKDTQLSLILSELSAYSKSDPITFSRHQQIAALRLLPFLLLNKGLMVKIYRVR